VPAATTTAYAAGAYDWQAQVSSGSEKHTIENGALVVLPDWFSGSAATAYDDRSSAAKIVEAIDALLVGRATIDQSEYEIATGNGSSRRLKFCSKAELLQIRSYYAAILANEEARERAEAGLPSKRFSYALLCRG
jgi:hypothetical protein